MILVKGARPGRKKNVTTRERICAVETATVTESYNLKKADTKEKITKIVTKSGKSSITITKLHNSKEENSEPHSIRVMPNRRVKN